MPRFDRRLGLALLVSILTQVHLRAEKPNIVVILCDDLGYGDVQCLNPKGKIPTPHIDQLAAEGMTFTDAHSGSAVCSPTRYGLMTGRYAWRSRLQSGVLGGLSPRLIEPKRETVASLLKTAGYHTACIGKWHLGMDWKLKPGKTVSELSIEPRAQVFNVEYGEPIANGPNSVGFDEYFGISASLDMVPFTYIRNDHVVALPTEDRDFPLFLGRANGRCRKGPAAPGFEADNVLPDLTKEAVRFIDTQTKQASSGKPFFLYLPFASPHTPVLPQKDWQGKSGLNSYGDFVMQTDAAVGQVLAALEKNGVAKNTLVIFTSDNGCSPQADFPTLLKQGHDPSYIFRGMKADIFEGGHHVPFLVRWPGIVKPGSTTNRLTCLTDVFATCAEIVGTKVPANAGEDSESFLGVLKGATSAKERSAVIHHSINGSFAIRDGKWKLCLCAGSGGWSAPRPNIAKKEKLPPVQLFDLNADIGEETNLAEKYPDEVKRLTQKLEQIVANGRSTPGPKQRNTVPVKIRK